MSHTGKRFPFPQVSYWWILLSLEKAVLSRGNTLTNQKSIFDFSSCPSKLLPFHSSTQGNWIFCLSMILMTMKQFCYHTDQGPCGSSITGASCPRDTRFDATKKLLNHTIKYWLLLWISFSVLFWALSQKEGVNFNNFFFLSSTVSSMGHLTNTLIWYWKSHSKTCLLLPVPRIYPLTFHLLLPSLWI